MLVQLTIKFNDPGWEAERQEAEAQKLMSQLRQIDEVETVKRIRDLNPPEQSMSPLGATIVGILTAEVSVENFKKLLSFLSDRLGNKSIELEVEANGRKLKIKASSREEMQAAFETAQKFVLQ